MRILTIVSISSIFSRVKYLILCMAIILIMFNILRSDQKWEITEETLIISENNIEPEDQSHPHHMKSTEEHRLIFIITPTYKRASRMADLTRMAQTLMHIKDILWIVVEDANEKSLAVSQLLERTKLSYEYLSAARPIEHNNIRKDGRGVSNRLKALEWLRTKYQNTSQSGVIYFADDDNSYDIRVFSEIRTTKKFSLFPVGLIANLGVSAPIMDKNTGQFRGFHDPYASGRKFLVDMAGFAVDLQLFLSKPKATMRYKAGFVEDSFLISLDLELKDIEFKANNCTEVYVWHIRTIQTSLPSRENLLKVKNYNETNLPLLYQNILLD